ncbi:hypothetical protein EM861_25330 (plasmid) [Enterobacter hormaechei subsp. hoffmannii]|nr:hypothetical protein EM861_25330 [Enterobacter hormaechei subsp. hoffmannii]
MSRLNPKSTTLRTLFLRSGNQCAFPGCDVDNNLTVGKSAILQLKSGVIISNMNRRSNLILLFKITNNDICTLYKFCIQ